MAGRVPRSLLLLLVALAPQRSHGESPFGMGGSLGSFLFGAWPFHCQAPLPLGQPCLEDYDCDPSQGHHCHISRKVCAKGQPEGAPCNGGNACGLGLGCSLLPPRMECFPIDCIPQPDGSEQCTQGSSLGIPCSFDNATAACPLGSNCNMALALPPGVGSGVCAPLPTEEGADCSFYVGHPVCGGGLVCLMGRGVCGQGGGLGDPCPIMPDRCDATQGLACISQTVEPFASTCLPARGRGEHCTSGGECAKGLFCDLHNLQCTLIRPADSSCRNGNECGEAPFDDYIGVDCVRGACVNTSKAEANCWPNLPHSQCTNGRVCRRTPAAAATERARLAKAEEERLVEAEVGAEGTAVPLPVWIDTYREWNQ